MHALRVGAQVVAGRLTAALKPRHRRQEFLAFMRQVARAFIDGWDERSHPFVWTKTADEVLRKSNPKKTSETGH